jgi:signal transduction histidine kinase
VTTSTARTISIAGVVLALSTGIAALVFVSITEPTSIVWAVFLLLAAGAYAVVGSLIASSHPRNPIGWLFVAVGVAFGVTSFTGHYAAHDPPLPGSAFAGILAIVAPAAALPFALPTFLLLFPEGRLLSPAWRSGVATAGLAGVVLTLGLLASPTADDLVDTPGWVEAIPGIGSFMPVGGVLTAAASVAGFASLLIRHRRSTEEDRQQLKWLLTMLTVMVGATAIAVAVSAAGVGELWIVFFLAILVVGLGVLVGIPAATAIAVLTFGLYDVGVVVKKTIVYGVLLAALALGLTFVLVLFSPLATGVGAGGGDGVGRITTVLLVAALAFVTTFRWLKRFVYRAVYGRRATPYEAIAEFSDRLGDAYSTEDVLPRTAEILRASTGAHVARVWLALDGELRPAAVSPSGAPAVGRHPVADGELPELAGRAFPVRHQGELLGAFSVEMPPSEPLSSTSERLAADLATQAGLVLRNVRLTEELKATIGELRASRQRIVSAQDDRARKLERDIHDGAQQQLVALAVKLRLAARLADGDAKTVALLSEIEGDAGDALENLRDLARGIYPPLLADKGLAAALEAQARKAAVPVRVEAEGVGRYPQEIEATVYFCCLEALQNVAKYAAANRATIRIDQADGALAFSVTDDGAGFEPATARLGSGLTNMRDRLEALGGALEIASAPGTGTRLSGRVPTRLPRHRQEAGAEG